MSLFVDDAKLLRHIRKVTTEMLQEDLHKVWEGSKKMGDGVYCEEVSSNGKGKSEGRPRQTYSMRDGQIVKIQEERDLGVRTVQDNQESESCKQDIQRHVQNGKK